MAFAIAQGGSSDLVREYEATFRLAGGEPILPRHPAAILCRHRFRYRRVVQTQTRLLAVSSAESAKWINNINDRYVVGVGVGGGPALKLPVDRTQSTF